MIKIRPLGTRELKQVLTLLERYSEGEFEYSVLQKFRQLYVPLHRLSQMLSPRWQFVPAIYVAVSQNQVLGLIWLSRDGRKANRWKIEQLILDPDAFSYDIGTQLIHYVINRYGAEGVQTFLALVDSRCQQALALLKTCGFRHCTRLHAFNFKGVDALKLAPESIQGLREARRRDGDKLKSLYNDGLPVEVRLSLEKATADFSRGVLRQCADRLQGVFFRRWVVEDPARDLLIAALEVETQNFCDFQLQLTVSPGWQEGYEALLAFGVSQVMKSTATASVFLQAYEFHPAQREQLQALGFCHSSVVEVLVKDYWMPIQEKSDKLTSPILLFSGKTSPACLLQNPFHSG